MSDTGWRLVKREATEEMLRPFQGTAAGDPPDDPDKRALYFRAIEYDTDCARNEAVGTWKAMLHASPPPGEDEGLVEWLSAKLDECEAATIPCSHCDGRGYHHGFGEDGHDPDWCDVCGGATYVPKYETNMDIARALLAIFDPSRDA